MNDKENKFKKALNGRCATCKHWKGDREESRRLFNDNELSMELYGGWPNLGVCREKIEFLNIEYFGNSAVLLEFYANFGCVYWEVEKDI